ncbi:MAG: helix-turn-helix domain-containing protein [Candidatus Saccharimonadales bacterium]
MARINRGANKSNGVRKTTGKSKSPHRQTIGSEIAEGLEKFAEALERGNDIGKEFNCRQVRFVVKTGDYAPKKVRQTRRRIHCSQAVFAEVMGVTPSAVRSWEQGSRPPSKTACRLMDAINREPASWIDLIADAAVVKRVH